MSGLCGERRRKRQLRPTVAFAEWMDGVQLPKKVRRFFGEGVRFKAGEILCFARSAKSRPFRGLNSQGSRRNFPFEIRTVRKARGQVYTSWNR